MSGVVGALASIAILAQFAVAQEPTNVRADGLAVWGDTRLVEELRLGTLDGDVNYSFGLIGGVMATRAGDIWVGDHHLGAIRRYAQDGSFLGQVGRSGEGPGEFQYPRGIKQLFDGSVVVWDDGQIQVSRFTESGEFLESFSPETFMIGGSFEEFELAPDGDLYLVHGTMPTSPGAGISPYWARLRLDGSVVDTLPLAPSEREGIVDRISTVTAISPLGYRVVGRTDDYSIELHAEGGPIRISRAWEPVPYSRQERRETQQREELFAEVNGVRPRRIPSVKPAFSNLWVDSQGRIWVQLYVPGFRQPESDGERASRVRSCSFFAATDAECEARVREWRTPVVFDVISPDGRYFGQVRLPNLSGTLAAARDDLIWVIEKGAYGEEYVVRYRIERAEAR